MSVSCLFRRAVFVASCMGNTLWKQVRNTNILERTRMVPVEEQFRQRHLQWFDHVWRMPTSHPQRQLLTCKPSGRGRPTGGAPLRWCDLINQDLRGITKWTESIIDRQQWRAQICSCIRTYMVTLHRCQGYWIPPYVPNGTW